MWHPETKKGYEMYEKQQSPLLLQKVPDRVLTSTTFPHDLGEIKW